MNVTNVRLRSAAVSSIRRFFAIQGFTEMLTPRLVGLPGQEPHLDPLWTDVVEQNGSKHRAALITSPEYAMKRLLAEGLDKIYDLGPCFRNGEPFDGTHDPEFLLLEWYRRNAGLEVLMRDTEAMIRFVIDELAPNTPFFSSTPFRRLSVVDAWKQYTNIDLTPLLHDREAMASLCRERNQTVNEQDTWDDLYFKIFLTEIEPHLGTMSKKTHFPPPEGGVGGGWNPTFLHRYPLSMASLARPCEDDPRFADRVELYIGDLELANGFAELCDPVVQRERFEEEQKLRQSMGKPTWPIDDAFIEALPKMGDAAGIAFGVDRLVMLITGATSINDVIPFSARERLTYGRTH